MASLTSKNQRAMDKMLERVLDAYKAGAITRDNAVAGLAHVIAAVDLGNRFEYEGWFNQHGVSFFTDE